MGTAAGTNLPRSVFLSFPLLPNIDRHAGFPCDGDKEYIPFPRARQHLSQEFPAFFRDFLCFSLHLLKRKGIRVLKRISMAGFFRREGLSSRASVPLRAEERDGAPACGVRFFLRACQRAALDFFYVVGGG